MVPSSSQLEPSDADDVKVPAESKCCQALNFVKLFSFFQASYDRLSCLFSHLCESCDGLVMVLLLKFSTRPLRTVLKCISRQQKPVEGFLMRRLLEFLDFPKKLAPGSPYLTRLFKVLNRKTEELFAGPLS